MQDRTIAEILDQYDAADYSHGEMLEVSELADRTVQVWFQRGKLDALGVATKPGCGNQRRYTLWHLLALSFIRRLTFLSIPVTEAVTIAMAYAPIGHRAGRPVTPMHVITVLPALEAALDGETCEEQVYSLIYRHIDGAWTNRIAGVEELDGLTNWVATCTKDSVALVSDLGAITREALERARLVQKRRAAGGTK